MKKNIKEITRRYGHFINRIPKADLAEIVLEVDDRQVFLHAHWEAGDDCEIHFGAYSVSVFDAYCKYYRARTPKTEKKCLDEIGELEKNEIDDLKLPGSWMDELTDMIVDNQ